MSHLRRISRPNRPALAISQLEKQAAYDMIQQGITQLAALINVLIGFFTSWR